MKGKTLYKVITVESMVAPVNRTFLGIQQIQVFREDKTLGRYSIQNLGDDYVKKNARTGKPNKHHFKHDVS